MKTILIIASSLLTVAAILPYLNDIFKKKTKPRVVSWFTWSILAAIASAASFSDKQYAAGILSLCGFVECMSVVVLGLKYGDRHFAKFDLGCQIGAIIGLALWFIYNSPAIAVIAAISIDFIGSLPTLKHAWEKPEEETWITFMLSGLGASLTVMAANNNKITAVANPLYLVLINAIFTVILLSGHKIKRIL